MILSRWVPKFLNYKEFKNYDHYIIDQQYQNDQNNTIFPKHLSSGKQKSLMMPKNHFDTQYNYYDSVQNSTSIISSDPRALFYNQEQKYKIKKYIKVLELTFEQLYESKFEKEEHNLFHRKTYLSIGLYAMIHIIKNIGMLFILMGTRYILQIISKIQNVKIKKD